VYDVLIEKLIKCIYVLGKEISLSKILLIETRRKRKKLLRTVAHSEETGIIYYVFHLHNEERKNKALIIPLEGSIARALT
jgi:hypothetical protein